VNVLATSAARQTATLQGVAHAAGEQATATGEVLKALRELRVQSREVTTAINAQAQSASASLPDLELVNRESAALRVAVAEQAEQIAALGAGASLARQPPLVPAGQPA
jgi:hypothetical protein